MRSLNQCIVILLLWFTTSSAAYPSDPSYRLRLHHLHTGEYLNIVYRDLDTYLPTSLSRLNQFLRDHRTGDVHQFDPRLFDVLHDLTVAAGNPEAEIDVVCGYRTTASNEFLRRTSSGVASHSLHMIGDAIDIRIPGISMQRLRTIALGLHRGGVGYYPRSGFIHVDVGRVRQWSHW